MMEEWVLQVAQFVWFTDDVSSMRASEVYSSVFGDEADSIQNNRSVTPSVPFLSQASSTVDETFQQVLVAPGRVDVVLAHPDRPQSGPWGWKLADGMKRVNTLAGAFAGRLGKAEKVSRVAVVLTLIRNFGNASAATSFVIDRTGLAIDPAATDLSLQINLQKAGIHSSKINRIVKFGTANLREMTLGMTGGVPTVPQFGPDRHVANFQVDINTMPVARQFDPGSAVELFEEVLKEAVALAKAGRLSGLMS